MSTESPARQPIRDRLRRHTFGYGIWAAVRITASWASPSIIGEPYLYKAIQEGRGVLLVAWHGTILLPIHHLRDRGYWAMVSPSRDGQMEEVAFKRLGWRTIAGSSRRGGTQAVLAAARRLRRGEIVAMVPDGPRGPRELLKPGTGYLAALAGSPVIPIGSFAADAWILNTWDKFRIPKPGTRTAVCFGPPVRAVRGESQQKQFEKSLAAALREANDLARQAAEGG